MTALQVRIDSEEETDRLELLYRLWAHNSTCDRIVHRMPIDRREWQERRRQEFRPFDKQGDVEPFDVEADWRERA